MTGARQGLDVVHLEGVTGARVHRLDADTATSLRGLNDVARGTVVADLVGLHDADPGGVADAVTTAGIEIAVAHDADVAAALRAAGVEVHESLDAALHDSATALREAEAGAPPAPLAPAQGDSQIVTTEDFLDRDPRA